MSWRKPSVLFISWQPYCSRSDNFARELGGKSYKIYYDFFGSNYYTILFKYGCQFFKTLLILIKEKPDAVLVMNPSVFACIPVFLYTRLKKSIFIIDAHTGALVDPMWAKVKFLQKFFARRALFSVITNEAVGKEIRGWGCTYKIVPDVPIRYEHPNIPTLPGKPNVTLVNTFSKDEPLDEFLAAANKLRSANFFITGKLNGKSLKSLGKQDSHIRFTDFLPDADYYGLLLASDLVVVLTTRDNTMQRGAYEAIYLGKPVVTSNWKILQDNFPVGAVFVDNTALGILDGITSALNQIEDLTRQAGELRGRKQTAWQQNLLEIQGAITNALRSY